LREGMKTMVKTMSEKQKALLMVFTKTNNPDKLAEFVGNIWVSLEQAQGLIDGTHKIVPIEPTSKMRRAGMKNCPHNLNSFFDVGEIYKAMTGKI